MRSSQGHRSRQFPGHHSGQYTGRFAPSPTGPLHLGSLLTAVASYLDCRAAGGCWLLRIEDLDPPRESPGAAEQIITALGRHGMAWDRPILWQHQRQPAYEQALATLLRRNQAFRCSCSRSRLAASGGIHQGLCAPPGKDESDGMPSALRLQVDIGDDRTITHFCDRLQGDQQQDVAREVGDFVVRRKDGLYAYQLAVVVDDAFQGVTDVVRGCDLLDSTARQIVLQQALRLPPVRYLHLPVLVGPDGQKLSKQNLAPPLNPDRACDNLRLVLQLLNQPAPPPELETPQNILAAAARAWSPARLPAVRQLPAPV